MGKHSADNPSINANDGQQNFMQKPANQPGEQSIDNSDFISGRVSRKDRRKQEAAASTPGSQTYLGPADDHSTTDIPTFNADNANMAAEQVTQAYDPRNMAGAGAAGVAGAGAGVPGAQNTGMPYGAQPGLTQPMPSNYNETPGMPTQAGMVDPAHARFHADNQLDPMTATAQQPPVQIPPQAHGGHFNQTGLPDDDFEDDDDEKRSPLVLVLSIALVAALLVIAVVVVWALSFKGDPDADPSESIETSIVEESSEPTSTQDTDLPDRTTEQPDQPDQNNETPAVNPTPNQPAPRPEATPNPKPEPEAPAPEPAPSAPAPDPNNP